MNDRDIYSYVKSEETAFKLPVEIIDGWDWNFPSHIRKSFLYKNSQFERDNENRDKRPFKNILLAPLNAQYRAEGFDVKDIAIYVNDAKNYYKSFLVKKYHNKWAIENQIDTFIDEVVESYVDYGGVLVKKLEDARPEVVNLRSIAFCDQTNILSGPFAIEHNLSPVELREMKGWGDKSKGATIDIETLITLARKNNKDGKDRKLGQYIKVYEVHGIFSEKWLKGDPAETNDKYVPQLHIIAYYKNENNQDIGVTLFKAKEPELPFKFLSRDEVYGRALGTGGIEELFEAQIWTNYSEIQIREMLDLAAKTYYKTTDPTFKSKNQLVNNPTGTIFDLKPGTDMNQIDTTPRDLVVFSNWQAGWGAHGKEISSSGPALLGTAPTNHVSFAFQRLITQQATAIHDYRRGKIATFMGEIYRDWIIKHIVSEISNGQKFLAELDLPELQQVSESIITCETNKMIIEKILNGETIDQQTVDQYKQQVHAQFMKGGNKKFIEIFKGEIADAPVDVEMSIGGKQKDLMADTATLVKLYQITPTPELLNKIIEFSGLDPINFNTQPKEAQNRVSESISFKDLPPDGQQQMAAQAGIKIAPPQPQQPQQLPQLASQNA